MNKSETALPIDHLYQVSSESNRPGGFVRTRFLRIWPTFQRRLSWIWRRPPFYQKWTGFTHGLLLCYAIAVLYTRLYLYAVLTYLYYVHCSLYAVQTYLYDVHCSLYAVELTYSMCIVPYMRWNLTYMMCIVSYMRCKLTYMMCIVPYMWCKLKSFSNLP